jgi:hypothetical protein
VLLFNGISEQNFDGLVDFDHIGVQSSMILCDVFQDFQSANLGRG